MTTQKYTYLCGLSPGCTCALRHLVREPPARKKHTDTHQYGPSPGWSWGRIPTCTGLVLAGPGDARTLPTSPSTISCMTIFCHANHPPPIPHRHPPQSACCHCLSRVRSQRGCRECAPDVLCILPFHCATLGRHPSSIHRRRPSKLSSSSGSASNPPPNVPSFCDTPLRPPSK